jgi:hypothetical protein
MTAGSHWPVIIAYRPLCQYQRTTSQLSDLDAVSPGVIAEAKRHLRLLGGAAFQEARKLFGMVCGKLGFSLEVGSRRRDLDPDQFGERPTPAGILMDAPTSNESNRLIGQAAPRR